MAHQNRVTPDGRIIADPARGTLFGNRGCLHRADGRLKTERWTTRRWIFCRLRFKDRRRPFNPPGRYTGLYFLDEATALAAGHRPCAECRRADYLLFMRLAGREGAGADALDRALHAERITPTGERRLHQRTWGDLPAGAVAAVRDRFLLKAAGLAWAWTPAGWTRAAPIDAASSVVLLTPPVSLGALENGFPLNLHPSITSETGM